MKVLVIGKSLQVEGGRCPACRAMLSGATPVGGRLGPEAGSVSVCAYCAAILVYQADLSLRCATPAERETLLQDETVALAHTAVVEMIAQRRGKR